MLVVATPLEGTGTQVTLNAADDLLVPRGVGVRSLNDVALRSTGFVTGVAEALDIQIDGQLTTNASTFAVALSGLTAEDSARVVIGAEGLVSGLGGLTCAATDGMLELVNHGTLLGAVSGLSSAAALTRVVNDGRILSFGAVNIVILSSAPSGARLVIENSGWISGLTNGAPGQDLVRNTGRMGAIFFGDGNDLYFGRLGQVSGTLDGGAGDDRFALGAGGETVQGGIGVDTVDFQGGAAVTLDLADMARATGRARGDVYLSIEIFQGSGKGDRLRGNGADNTFFGNGGADRLAGGEGIDFLAGGAGRDTLTGGLGDDTFFFRAAKDGADVIRDFSSDGGPDANDRLAILASGFGGGLVSGALDPALFRVGASKAARDLDDRFIFRTRDATLWFDADGSGRKAPVLIADLQNGSLMTAADIVIY